MKNAVVVVTHNRIKLLKECLGCINSQEIPFSRVIVVNNCSTDGTREYLDQIEDERYCILHSTENIGGSGGFSMALKEAQKEKFDWVLIVDDDAMISRDYMSVLIEEGEKHPQIPALCGSVIADEKIDLTHRRRVGNRLIFHEKNVPESEYEKATFLCDSVTFCGLLLRGSAFEKYGLPIEDYFIWCDDTEYCLRMYKNGEPIMTVPRAVLCHKAAPRKHKDSILRRIEWRSYYGYRNRYDAAKRHLGGLTPHIIRLEYKIFWLISAFMRLSGDDKIKSQGKYNMKLLKDVLSDTKEGRLGRRDEYL